MPVLLYPLHTLDILNNLKQCILTSNFLLLL
jgi:hypothetical protein